MEQTRFLIIGGGATGLAFANRIAEGSRTGADGRADWLLCEAEQELGGYCRTVRQGGFVWDYSGHFFHFKHPEIERYLVQRMPQDETILKVTKVSWIRHGDRYIHFPFQKNIHQLPFEEFLECLEGLVLRDDRPPTSFRGMLDAKLGRGIADKFLVPYNEKLYATDLATLDVDAMGRFFPHASLADIVRNFRQPDNASYNATFTYPAGGAVQYIHALAQGLDPTRLRTGHAVVALDLAARVATVRDSAGAQHAIHYEHVVSSVPFPRLLQMAGVAHDPALYTANKVLVFNLGFDKKGPPEPHWIYYAARDVVFYRVGFYDNIFGTPRMSIYVEIGLPADAPRPDDAAIAAYRERVLGDLRKVGVTTDHQLVADHHVVLDPAYVHITRASQADLAEKRALLALGGVHSLGRYGGWTYCGIEDNLIEAWALADRFRALGQA